MGCIRHFFVFFIIYLPSQNILATDWIMFFGVEPEKKQLSDSVEQVQSLKPKFLAFLQPHFQHNKSDEIVTPDGLNRTPFAYLAPDLQEQSDFTVFRAKLGMRGKLNKNNNINYFLLSEFGNNGLTNPLGYEQEDVYLTDASLTFSYISNARIRIGRFYTPGSEEGLSIINSPFINFTHFTESQLLERYIGRANSITRAGVNLYTGTPDRAVSAFHDTGLQIFDAIPVSDNVNFTYAVMAGLGQGVSSRSSGDNDEQYYYFALEQFNDTQKGLYSDSYKAFLWYQTGTRELKNQIEDKDFRRTRYGLGLTYKEDKLLLGAEASWAKGMILNGIPDTNNSPSDETWQVQYAPEKSNKAEGWQVYSGYEIFPKLSLLARFDRHDFMTNSDVFKRRFDTLTFGLSYRFKGPNRIDINYAMRDAKAANNPVLDKFLEEIDDLISIRLTMFFAI